MIFYHNKKGSAKSKIFDYFPFGKILKQKLYFYFNPIDNEEKMKLSGYFASPTMLQSVAWLSFSVSDASQKIEN